jgi:chemotaxis protein methyltransferase CheR
MTDADGVAFLLWCLPRLGLRWRGFRRVRRIVHRRLQRRLTEVGLPGVAAYRAYLEAHPEEWAVLDALCRIPLSRFYRDRAVFEWLERVGLPELGRLALGRGQTELRCWSAGCAAGEEPYTLALLWRLRLASGFPGLRLRIVATDADGDMIAQATRACYPPHALRDLPADLRAAAFVPSPEGVCLVEDYRRAVEFRVQDRRAAAPEGRFHLILCRNLVLTYFEEAWPRQVLARLADALEPEPGPGGLRRVEGVEDPRDRLRRKAGSRVGDDEPEPTGPLRGRSRLDPDLPAVHPGLTHGLAGIRQEIQQHLLEGRGVTEHRRQRAVQAGDDPDAVGGQGPLHHLDQLVHDEVEVDRAVLAGRLAGEGAQAAGDRGHPLGRPVEHLEIFPHAGR